MSVPTLDFWLCYRANRHHTMFPERAAWLEIRQFEDDMSRIAAQHGPDYAMAYRFICLPMYEACLKMRAEGNAYAALKAELDLIEWKFTQMKLNPRLHQDSCYPSPNLTDAMPRKGQSHVRPGVFSRIRMWAQSLHCIDRKPSASENVVIPFWRGA